MFSVPDSADVVVGLNVTL
jgi:hypothetical protein